MSKLILHVGLMKSGTTYLQNILSNNRIDLKSNGWSYPGKLLNQQHACYGLCGEDIPWIKKTDNFKTLSEQLIRGIKESEDDIIISAECLASLDTHGIKNFLGEVGVPDRVIVTIRGLFQSLPSAWQQSIKGGGLKSIERFYQTLALNRPQKTGFWKTYSFGQTVELWSKFAPTFVVVVPDNSETKSKLWDLFCEAAGLPILNNLTVDDNNSNISINFETAEIIRKFNFTLKNKGIERRTIERLNNLYIKEFVLPFRNIVGTKISHSAEFEERIMKWNKEEITKTRISASEIYGEISNLDKQKNAIKPPINEDDMLTSQLVSHLTEYMLNRYR